ncbi:hypothetical protein BA190_09595 [Labrys sp. WJW]|uniref:helix-turn-helix domain-containing protein n=1 Tax=Labrys sp. WJW TaxID=1737983 RepID=UPI00083263EE|nr:helix-turn-helix transcriptional regulator [Labrys sp. WJW]OCC05158.1 hypothetical protein BA190_09595 [Labrys sp. WJW]
MNRVDKRWFLDRIADVGTSQRRIGAAIGVDPSTMSLLLAGKRRMTVEVARNLALHLQTSVDEVIARAGIPIEPDNAERLPIIGYVGGDGTISLDAEPKGKVPPPPAIVGDVSALVMRTAQTELDFMNGWTAYIGPEERRDFDRHIDRFVIAKMPNEAPVLRVIRRGASPDVYTLTGSGTSEPMHDVRLEWIRRVLLFRPL